MNTIRISPNPKKFTPYQVGSIYRLNGSYYILAKFSKEYFLVNVEDGSTWNGFKDSIEKVFGEVGEENFCLVEESINITPSKI